MYFSRIGILLFLLAGIATPTRAQSLDVFNFEAKKERYHTEFAAILHNGKLLVKTETPDGPYLLEPQMRGKLSVSTVDRTVEKYRPIAPIGFKIAIKNYHKNTFWMYSEKTFYEIDIDVVTQKCGPGDQLIFMVADRQYQLPRHTILVLNGC